MLIQSLLLLALPIAFSLELGMLTTRSHEVSGTVKVISDRILEIDNFVYDGLGPAAYLWIDSLPNPSNPTGKIIYDVGGSCGEEVLGAYNGETLRVELPEGTRLQDYAGGSISVWCERFSANFGEVIIPEAFTGDIPETVASDLQCGAPATTDASTDGPISLGEFTTRAHEVAGTVEIVSDRIIKITDFIYDGTGPAAFFWIDSEPNPSNPTGKIAYDVGGSCGSAALAAFNGDEVFVELPSSVKNYLGGSLSVWCERFSANFGEVLIPDTLPDSLPVTLDSELQCIMKTQNEPFSLGEFTTRAHEVAGAATIVSDRIIKLTNFFYDGTGPAAFFWIDSEPIPSNPTGKIAYDVGGSCGAAALAAYNDEEVFVELPSSVKNYLGGSLSVWCEAFSANFGEVLIPNTLPDTIAVTADTELECASPSAPKPVSLGEFTTRAHEVAGSVTIISDRVIELTDFVYDGTGPAAFFWIDSEPSPSNPTGKIAYDVGGSCGAEALAAYDSDRVLVELPSSIKNYLGGSFSVWCEAFSANFGEVLIPDSLPELPADSVLQCAQDDTKDSLAVTPANMNCEPLNENLQVRWAVEGDTLAVEIVVLDMPDYAAFGVSGSTERTLMDGADPIVVDNVNGPRARDFRMTNRSRCSGGNGVCHDEDSTSISNVSGDAEGQLTVIRYKQSISQSDIPFSVIPGDRTFVVWAMGPMSDQALPLFHSAFPRENVSIEFGRPVADNCEPLVTEAKDEPDIPVELAPYERPQIKDVSEIVAHIGPSGGDRGYGAITGRAPWGIAWYLNDILIPEVILRRGTTYTFKINGGDNPASNAEFHPFYLTTNPNGGYATLTPEQRAMETVFAGIKITERTDNAVTAFESTAAAPICAYRQVPETNTRGTYDEFFNSLDTSCRDDTDLISQAAVFEFTPDESTPDMILDADEEDPPTAAPILAPTMSPPSTETSSTVGFRFDETGAIAFIGLVLMIII